MQQRKISMILVSHPTGNANVRAVIEGLEAHGLLGLFQTTIANCLPKSLESILPNHIKQLLQRRAYRISADKISSHPFKELLRLIAAKMRLNILTKHEMGPVSIDAVYCDMDRFVSKKLKRVYRTKKITSVYCYEDGAFETFRAAKQLGLKCYYDLPIGYWRLGQKIQQQEALLSPEWAPTMAGIFDSEDKLTRKDEELKMADIVFVASEFTKKSLESASCQPLIVKAVYGAPSNNQGCMVKKYTKNQLKVLYVGQLSQRKGISYLFDAAKKMRHCIELTLIGRPGGWCSALERELRKHTWFQTMNHDQVLLQMRNYDVLVFPSLFEGFGLVILEAMSQGLPVITTMNTAGPDIIANGEDGFIIPVRSSEAICEKLELLMKDKNLLYSMSNRAIQKAKQFTWFKYISTIVKNVSFAEKGYFADDICSKII